MEITVHPEMWPHSLCLAQGREQQRAHSCVEREMKSTAKERQANVYTHQERSPVWVVVIFFPRDNQNKADCLCQSSFEPEITIFA